MEENTNLNDDKDPIIDDVVGEPDSTPASDKDDEDEAVVDGQE